MKLNRGNGDTDRERERERERKTVAEHVRSYDAPWINGWMNGLNYRVSDMPECRSIRTVRNILTR
jgi:hypothetical protein